MANADDDESCHFRWDISNPLLPFRSLKATFFFGVPWNVTLYPAGKKIDSFKFEFRLKCILPEEARIGARRIIVNISLNNQRELIDIDQPYYVFGIENQYTYRFFFNVEGRPRGHDPHCLVIRIEMIYRHIDIENQEGIEQVLEQLSRDLHGLLTGRMYSDLTLSSEHNLTSHPVHSYIIQERWCNFFARHGNEIFENAVSVPISCAVLSEILSYVYSARLDIGGGNWRNTSFSTELFQVIDHYELQHLYEVFASHDSRQFRNTKRLLVTAHRNYHLGDGYNRPSLTNHWDRWDVNPNTKHYLIFRIQFLLEQHPPGCSYTLESRCPEKMHVQVSLEFGKTFVQFNDMRTVSESFTVHQEAYSILPQHVQNSGSCPLRVNLDFRDFLSGNVRRIEGKTIEHFIRCVLHVADGTTVIEVGNEDAIPLKGDMERYIVLSNHMHRLLHNHLDYDLRIICHAEQPWNPEPQEVLHYIHQAIFKTRVPGFEIILGDVSPRNPIPLVRLSLKSEAFRYILCYIYAGKVYKFPVRYFDEIESFAIRGGMDTLIRIVEQMRWENESILLAHDVQNISL